MANLIRCKLNQHFVVGVGGVNYSFDRDTAGRYVARVDEPDHRLQFLSLDTYEAVADLPGVVPPAPAEEILDDPNHKSPTEILRELLPTAAPPQIFDHRLPGEDTRYYVAAPWPAICALTAAELANPPPFATVDGNLMLSVAVTNGQANYNFKGTIDGVHLYELAEGSSFVDLPNGVAPPAPPPADDDEDDDEDEDGVDHLVQISGISQKRAAILAGLGINSFAAIIALEGNATAIEDVEKAIRSTGAVARDKWIEQARELSAARATSSPEE